MRKLYFDIENGEVIMPRDITAPEFYVTLNEKDKIQDFYSCFSKAKIQSMGEQWKYERLSEDKMVWTSYTWLIRSLSRYVMEYSYLSERQNYEEEHKEHYVYLMCKST